MPSSIPALSTAAIANYRGIDSLERKVRARVNVAYGRAEVVENNFSSSSSSSNDNSLSSSSSSNSSSPSSVSSLQSSGLGVPAFAATLPNNHSVSDTTVVGQSS